MRFVIVWVLVCWAAWVSASAYGTDELVCGDSRVAIFINGFTESPLRRTSGTNESFIIGIGRIVEGQPIHPNVSYWTFDEITNMTLTIGGQSVDLLLPTEVETADWNKVVWFMSNRFAHDSIIDVVLTVSGRFRHVLGTTELGTTIVTKSITVQCQVYNDLLSWRTEVDNLDQPDASPDGYPAVAEQGLSTVRPLFTSMRHHVPDLATMTKTDIVAAPEARLKRTTGVFAFTHGDAAWVKDSGALMMNNGEVFVKVGARPMSHPQMNFAIYYACSMFKNSAQWFNAHFHHQPESAINRFFVGFDDIVFSRLQKSNLSPTIEVQPGDVDLVLDALLSNHAEVLITSLLSGTPHNPNLYEIEHALSHANDTYPPRGLPKFNQQKGVLEFPALFMKQVGDRYATLNVVYLYNVARESIERGEEVFGTLDTWYVTTW